MKKDSIAEILRFQVHGDHTGSLVALEKGADFPFEIKRVYYIWGTDKDVVRGHHAHKNLEQVIVCLSDLTHLIVQLSQLSPGCAKLDFREVKG